MTQPQRRLDRSPFSIGNEDILDLFSDAVRRLPDREALVLNNTVMSYAELDHDSSALASLLIKGGIEKGAVVAVMMERGIDLIISMIGILKAGAVFVPIDPRYPSERRNFILEDAQPALTLRSLDQVSSLLSKEAADFSVVQADCIDPAYIIYTSGTTGKPKGAINTRQGITNLAIEQISAFNVQSDSRVLQFASPSFDASISEIVMALCAGATLILAEQEELIPGPSLARLLRTQRISHLTLPPSVLAALQPKEFPDLKVLIVAGEACPIELIRRWSDERRIFNGYGVSEAAVCSSIREYDPALAALPIGKAMGGVKYYVLDESQRPVLHGEVGELYIGGLGVGLGYVNRPDLNNTKFIILEQHTGSPRVYRTGDLVRLLFDESLEYIGRIDNQVKIRGFRIELDEIANQLLEYPDIEQSAVVVRTDSHENKQIVAFFTVKKGTQSTEENLRTVIRSFLCEHLPAHMIPSLLVLIEAFPLSPTGKIDLKALREWRFDDVQDDLSGQSLTTTESTVLSLCKEVFDVGRIGITKSFLDLGGDSLQAAQLAWRIEEEFSINLTEPEILKAADLRSLSAIIDSRGTQDRIELTPIPRSGPVEPSPNQEIFGVLEQFGVDTSALNCCAAFEIAGQLDIELLTESYKKLFSRHEALRVHFPRVDGAFLIDVLARSEPELEIVDYTTELDPDRKIEEFYRWAERINFPIRNALLVRSFLLKRSSTESIFVFIAHHAIFDAWSLHIFLQDLFSIVAERMTGRTFLEPLKIQYLDFLQWSNQILKQRDEAAIHEHLSKIFKRPLKYFDLKTVMPRPPYKSMTGGNFFLPLGREMSTQLNTFCEGKQLTPFMVCTAALATALYCNSDQSDITIGGPVSIRYHRDLERQIGLYGAAYILRTILSDSSSFNSYLGDVREGLLAAYRAQVYAIGTVLEKYELGQDFSRTAPYDISSASHMFNLPLCLPEVQQILGINIKPLRYPLTTAFFDFEFTFHLFEGEIELETRYDAALYHKAQIEKISSDFLKILEVGLFYPSVTIGKLGQAL